ncbi:hypothetical protein CANMA_000678 [Candida margitis]|uniref:uncharacterized protein n=1 Tax=Candida margitis TaxID=1775924 RepID=UPI002227E0B5|nr:uncharacterized protein CANMA_000678 [Candida margitis]KAI5970325.1 hypothetical protein CANMA_000678 [Candida margitis]
MSSSNNQEALEQFKVIAGLESDDSSSDTDAKIHRLLTVHDHDLNNAILTYLESGFDTVESARTHLQNDIGSSSAIDTREIEDINGGGYHDNDDGDDEAVGELIHRSASTRTRGEYVNLQSQMFLNSLMPRLPKAPQISTRWQLDVGIHSSLIHEREEKQKRELYREKESDDETVVEQSRKVKSDTSSSRLSTNTTTNTARSSSILNTLWIILLIIPKNILSVIISSIKFFFGFGWSSSDEYDNNFKFNRSFDFDKFHPDYSYLSTLKEKEESKEQAHAIDLYDITESGFNELHSHCQKEYDWLLVVLTNDSIENTNFVNRLLKNSVFKKSFNRDTGESKSTKLYFANVDHSPEAWEIGQTYKIKKTPYVMLVANVSASPDVMASMSIVYKSNLSKQFIIDDELNVTVMKIAKYLAKNIDKYNPQLVAARYDKQETDFGRLIRQQQDDAYTQSLLKDKLKKQKRDEELRLKQEAENLIKLRRWFLFNLIKDNHIDSLTDGTNDSLLRVAVKLPSGKRLIEQFNKSISISQFFIYIELKLFIEEMTLELNHANENWLQDEAMIDELITELESDLSKECRCKFDDVQHYYTENPFKFEVVQPYPKKIIFCDSNLTIGQVPEFKGANFLVEHIVEEEDDEEDNGDEDEDAEKD